MPPIEQFHPMIVHFPIVLVLLLATFDIALLFRRNGTGDRDAPANVSAGLAVLAGLAAVAAYIFGDIAFDVALSKGTPAARLELHEDLGTITAATAAVWAVIRAGAWWKPMSLTGSRLFAVAIIEIAIGVLVITTAYFGGQLVYEHGIGVVQHISG